MENELISVCFGKGWRCFGFDNGESYVLLDDENYSIAINKDILNSCNLNRLRSGRLRTFANELIK